MNIPEFYCTLINALQPYCTEGMMDLCAAYYSFSGIHSTQQQVVLLTFFISQIEELSEKKKISMLNSVTADVISGPVTCYLIFVPSSGCSILRTN